MLQRKLSRVYSSDLLKLHSYFEIVKRPMDLSTIAAKLKAGDYGSRQDFANDFNLMLSNAYLFNPAGTDPHKDALEIEKLFKKGT